MKVQSSRFGELDVQEGDIVQFMEGLLGFPDFKRYTILTDASYDPFMWMQSLDEPELAFVLVDPLLVDPDYRVEANPGDIRDLGINSAADARVLVIVSIPENPEEMTANLKGPIVVNPATRMARQFVVMSERYDTKHPILRKTSESK